MKTAGFVCASSVLIRYIFEEVAITAGFVCALFVLILCLFEDVVFQTPYSTCQKNVCEYLFVCLFIYRGN